MNELTILLLSAASLGFVHTLLGPDHYLPFIVLSKARKWTQAKTLWITFVSGIGHVAGSVIIGIIGIAMGISLHRLEAFEAQRGNIVGWLIAFFGLMYTFYGFYKYLKNSTHSHIHSFLLPSKLKKLKHLPNEDDTTDRDSWKSLTPWVLFLIFVFGPCEVLIPLLIFPAAEFSSFGIVLVSIVFGLATVLTMLIMVFLGYRGFKLIKFKPLEKYMHLIAGLVILIAGVGMVFLGW
ncbi:MAG TPA: sulfite exporter TauE/SafE family protein [Prolixibacteraceae bacterium]|nr:sulfite exporter TauE/SafE family protein [Prolixibacteraceae bacterium]